MCYSIHGDKPMKKFVLSSLSLALISAAGAAHAQSSVTLYGLIDTGLTFSNNSGGERSYQQASGVVNGSRWGLRGSEDLGNGLKAIFDLESGINLQDGSASDSQRLFNRNAYVGLSSQYGTVTFGRQKTPLFDLLGDTYDPLTVGNYAENSWLPGALGAGLYADNAVKYTGTYNGLTLAATYSFGTNSESTGVDGFSGQVPGHLGAGNMYGFTLSYVAGPLSVAAGVQQNSDNSNNKQTIFNANAVYSFSSAKVYVGYLHSKDDTGFVDSALAQQTLVPGVDFLKGSGRIDNGPFAGVTWQTTRALTLTGAAYYDHMSNAAIGNGEVGSGYRYTFVALAEYALSKRTEVYGTVDFDKVSGAASVELPGRSNQTGVALGMRTIF
jgi:predicted porin